MKLPERIKTRNYVYNYIHQASEVTLKCRVNCEERQTKVYKILIVLTKLQQYINVKFLHFMKIWKGVL